MATLPLKSSRHEQRAVICLLWAKGLKANETHSEMRPVYGDKCFMRPAIQVWCTKFARGRESIAAIMASAVATTCRQVIPYQQCFLCTQTHALCPVTSAFWFMIRICSFSENIGHSIRTGIFMNPNTQPKMRCLATYKHVRQLSELTEAVAADNVESADIATHH